MALWGSNELDLKLPTMTSAAHTTFPSALYTRSSTAYTVTSVCQHDPEDHQGYLPTRPPTYSMGRGAGPAMPRPRQDSIPQPPVFGKGAGRRLLRKYPAN